MTIGQYLASFTVLSILVVACLLIAVRRGSAILAATAILFIVLGATFFRFRPRSNGVYALKTAIITAVAVAIAAVIVYLRRAKQDARGRALTGVLAVLGLMFAWFETAYLLR